MSFRRGLPWVMLMMIVVATSCATDRSTGSTTDAGDEARAPATPALDLLVSSRSPYSSGDDVWEVWTCHVPYTVGHALYADDTWRMDRTADDLVALFEDGVGEWYATLSHGRYRPVFLSGGRVSIGPHGDGHTCVERALTRASPGAAGILVVADARHRDGASGGWGRPGTCGSPCTASTARSTGRAVYVGAADFGPDWADQPPVDLVHHELGHTLDLPHSGIAAHDEGSVNEPYTSPIDMMSDSAAPRQVRPDRRDAPDTLAANRIALGWLDDDEIVIVPPDGLTIDLHPSTEATRPTTDPVPRVLIVPLDGTRLITIELLVPTAANDHLPESGVAVHLVDQGPSACDRPGGGLCTGQYRRQVPLVDDVRHPGVPLIGPGRSVDVGPVVVHVQTIDGATSRVAIEPG